MLMLLLVMQLFTFKVRTLIYVSAFISMVPVMIIMFLLTIIMLVLFILVISLLRTSLTMFTLLTMAKAAAYLAVVIILTAIKILFFECETVRSIIKPACLHSRTLGRTLL